MYGNSLHRDKLVLHDDEVYKAFLGDVKTTNFISSSPSQQLPEDASGVYLRYELSSSNDFKTYTR
jgi:hypothetical protein